MKKYFNILGIVLTVAACIYVLWRLSGNTQLPSLLSKPSTSLVFAGCVLLALVANSFLAAAWVVMVDRLEGRPVSKKQLFMIYAWTQMGKYLPGNVFHFAGRYGMGLGAGISNKTLASTTILEPVFLILVAGLISLPFLLSWLFQWFWLAVALILCGLVVFLAGVLVVYRVQWLRENVVELSRPVLVFLRRRAVTPVLLYAVFLFFGGLIVVWLLAVQGADWPVWTLVSANAFAWVLGYVTIGAPAGIGIREAALIFALGQSSVDAVVAMVALYRLATLGGDFLFFLIGAIGLKKLSFS